jgi:hypothetical protein
MYPDTIYLDFKNVFSNEFLKIFLSATVRQNFFYFV